MRAILVEESTPEQLPRKLEVLISSLAEDEARRSDLDLSHDLLVVVLYRLMRESGFTPLCTSPMDCEDDKKKVDWEQEFNPRQLNSSLSLPCNWRRQYGSLYQINFVLNPVVKEYQFRLLVVPSGDFLIVNIIVDSGVGGCVVPARSICFSIWDYIANPRAQTAALKFRGLRGLSMLFKNELTSPVRSAVLTYEGVMNPSLQGVPDEIKLKILKFLDAKDVISVSCTCKSLYQLGRDYSVWKCLLLRDFHCGTQEELLQNPDYWRREYVARYKKLIRRTRHFESMLPDQYHVPDVYYQMMASSRPVEHVFPSTFGQ
ncbi:F-box only protein 7 [Periplaneta americana]|uniref:F-box only protein 7 n=1 Tax=Periplaneta americana TaxID=6978 RepID=UPI0037E7D347